MEKQLRKIESLREDLKMQFQELKPTPGSTIVISPKSDEFFMSDTYMEFVAETLQNIMGPQIKFLILPHNQIQITEKKD